MKAVSVCVVFIAVCVTLVMAEQSPNILILNRVMHHLKKISLAKNSTFKNSTLLHSPNTSNLKHCCEAAALECFRSQVLDLTTGVKQKHKTSQKIVSNELQKSSIVNAVSTCKPEETQKAECKPCASQEKVDGPTFVHNFRTLLERINSSQQ